MTYCATVVLSKFLTSSFGCVTYWEGQEIMLERKNMQYG